MNSSDLEKVFSGEIKALALHEKISEEVTNYSILSQKRGSSIPLYFFEDTDLVLTKKNMIHLINETIAGNLNSIDLAYICDCLTLAEKVNFKDEQVKDIVFEFADPEINGGYKSVENLAEYLSNLRKL